MIFEGLTSKVINAAMKVHTTLGPGLFEQVYKVCLRHELAKSGLKVLSEVGIPVNYDGQQPELGYRIDLLIEDTLIVELKSSENLIPLHRAQLLTYLRLASRPLGLLINFNVPHLRNGISRVINTPLRDHRVLRVPKT